MKFRRVALFAGALLASVAAVQANTITVGNPVVTGSGPYTWTYSAALNGTGAIPQNRPAEADFFQIDNVYGFTGFTSATFLGAGGSKWAASTSAGIGGTTNLKFTYVPGSASSDLFETIDPLVTVAFTDVSGVKTNGFWRSQDHTENATGTAVLGQEALVTGQGTKVPAAVVPLPAAAWGGMGLMGVLGGVQALRRRAMK